MSIGSILYTTLISPLKLVFELVFTFADAVLKNPGLTIIVLSLAINLLVLPLYRRADAMQEEERDIQAKLKDGVAHIRKTFKGDERMMMLQTYYRQNNYKPTYVLRGAMSLFLEIPFFIAAYSFLSNLSSLSGVSLGPIRNLAEPDGLLSLFGLTINLLPVLMTAVNCVSSAIFSKGFPTKTKVQLYAMAAFFLVFLYDSPSGLVFYWTLNNVFSLVKTIFYKLKNPKKVLAMMAEIIGVMLAVVGAIYLTESRRIFVVALGAVLVIVASVVLLRECGKLVFLSSQKTPQPNKKLFWSEAVLLTILAGALIPGAVVKASPLEFIRGGSFYHPLWYVAGTLFLAAGFFLVWLAVFYWLASPKGKVWFERLLFVVCGVAIVDYMFFGRNLGVLSAALEYENGLAFGPMEARINLVVVLATVLVLLFLVMKWNKMARRVAVICALALFGMAAINAISVNTTVRDYLKTAETAEEGKVSAEERYSVTLSTTGENVIVLMLDRAAAHLVPYILNEDAELAEQFSGFTYYDNVLSYARFTNMASPALYGGYEYSPYELQLRDEELLEDKQNEVLKVMPVMFLSEGYDVTVYDPTYAGYQWIPDLSIYDDYPEIKTGITTDAFNEQLDVSSGTESQRRTFFCYSVMKMLPVPLQYLLYNDAAYRHQIDVSELKAMEAENFAGYPMASSQTILSPTMARGAKTAFFESYNVLTHLPEMTKTSEGAGRFFMMSNDSTHEPVMLQEPDYVPRYEVDNTAYEQENDERYTLNGVTVYLETGQELAYYQTNMAVMRRLGEWFDYLRELGVYDNTRIIIVSDHNTNEAGDMDEFMTAVDGEAFETMAYFPLLLVKDFNSTDEWETNSEFMTNADVPTLAMEGVIEDMTNPFTGKLISSDAKQTDPLYVIESEEWETSVNNGTTFIPGQWYRVDVDESGEQSWSSAGYGVLPEDLVP